MWNTAKPTEHQKRLTVLADSLAKQSVSRQCKFLQKSSDLHQPGSTGQCMLSALVANAIFIRLHKWDNSLSLCSSGKQLFFFFFHQKWTKCFHDRFLLSVKGLHYYSFFNLFNRPGVAGAVLQTALLLIKSFSDGLWKYLYSAATP